MHPFLRQTPLVRVSLILLAALLVAAVMFSPTSGDAPFYIAMSRDISNGEVPYRDILLSYTPVVMYVNAAIWAALSNPPYMAFLVFQYAIILISGFVLYRIVVREGLSTSKAKMLSVFFLICILSSDGTYINLEVYGILLFLLAYDRFIRSQYILAGAILAMNFLCKQYGILHFAVFGLMILTLPNRLQALWKFSLGAVLVMVAFFAYYVAVAGVPMQELLHQLSGQGYGQQNMVINKSARGFLNSGKVFLLLLVPLLFLKVDFRQRKQQLFLLGTVLLLLPVAVQFFQHYYLNAFPYVALLIALNWKDKELHWSVLAVPMLIAAALLSVRLYTYSEKARWQRETARGLARYYPKGSEVYLRGTINYLYIMNDYRNPALKQAGYWYAFKPDSEFLEKHTVLTFDPIPAAKLVQILNINGTKIYEY